MPRVGLLRVELAVSIIAWAGDSPSWVVLVILGWQDIAKDVYR